MHRKAEEFSKSLHLVGLKNSVDWLQKFKSRNNYKLSKLYGEIDDVDKVDISDFAKIFIQKIQQYGPDNVYNMDET